MTDMIMKQMIKYHIIKKEDEDIYRFGLECLLLKTLHYLSYLVIAFFLQEWVRFLIFFAAFLFLRKNAGGCHAKTRSGCYFISCMTVALVIIFMKAFSLIEDMISIFGILLAIAACSDIYIMSVAPLGSRNRELDEEEIKFFRKKVILFLICDNFFIILFLIMGLKQYALPVMLAVICQAFLLILEKIRKE